MLPGIPRLGRLAFLVSVSLGAAVPAAAQTAPPTGGFIASTADGAVRAPLTAAQLQGLVPERGVFTFPAPYGTQGIRLTNAADCQGGDCVDYGYSYWNKINNHAGSDTMFIVVGLNRARGGAGPTLFTYNKQTGATHNAGPLFDANSPFSAATAEQWYFSGSRPTVLYVGENGPRLLRYDVMARTFETVFDVTTLLGGGRYLWQTHSSADDRVHSATVKDAATYRDLGCLVYREDTRQHRFFTPRGDYDECQIDKSGRWLVIKENVDNSFNEDNRVIDLETGVEQVLWDQHGAAGHSDMGFGYIVGEDDKWADHPYGVRVWQFGANMQSSDGRLVYALPSWAGPGVGHIAHGNARPDLTLNEQMACSSNAGDRSLARTNEIVCYRLNGSMQVLVVAPNMTDLNAPGGGSDAYSKRPKGNIDPTGEYFLWTSNMGGHRADVFIVRIPSQLLGVFPASAPPAPGAPAPTPAPAPAPAAPSDPPPATAAPPIAGEGVQWMFTVNVAATASSLVKAGGCDGCADASAVSNGQITGNGTVQFAVPEAATLRYVGLAVGGAGTAPQDLNYAVRLQNGVAEVREANAYRTEVGFNPGDTFAISVANGTVTYWRNGVAFYTSATQAAVPLRLHAVLFSAGAAVTNIGFGGGAAPAAASTAPSTLGSFLGRRAVRRPSGSAPRR